MNGVHVMMTILRARQPLVALVPAARIFAGTVPQNAELPAIGVTEIGRNGFQTLANAEPGTLVRARIQVTVHAKNYLSQKAVILAAKLGPGVHTGVIGGVKVRSVIRGDVGPDLSDEDAGIYQQSRDFMVSYIEPN